MPEEMDAASSFLRASERGLGAADLRPDSQKSTPRWTGYGIRSRPVASSPIATYAATSVVVEGERYAVGWHAPRSTMIRRLAPAGRALHIEMLAAAAADGQAGFATFAEQGSRVGRTFHRDPIRQAAISTTRPG
jgi:hypothetical protein